MIATSVRSEITTRYEKEFAASRQLFAEAKKIFPDGVTHDLRRHDPFPVYVKRAAGARKWDADGHELIDFWSGHGALLLGHSPPPVVEAVQRQMALATHPGACHELEIEWGKMVQRLIPSAQRMRFVSSGTEATMMALRLARIFTGKRRVLKFLGHFHGWNDFLIPGADAPFEPAAVPGVSSDVAADTVIIPPNDPAAVERTLASDRQIGCVILEPTGGHYGSVPVRGDFLRALRDLTAKHERLLIFDEVITGFRVHPGGAQSHYGVTPDLTTMAKILAGGLPGGCVAGRADILAGLETKPGKPKMRHPGTFNANPLSAAAGITTLKLVATGEPCRRANDIGRVLRRELNAMFASRGINWLAYGEFSSIKLVPEYDGPPPSGEDFVPYGGDVHQIEESRNPKLAHAFRCAMLLHGIDLPGFACMTTAVHTEKDVTATVDAVAASVDMLQKDGLV
jgi:glutamate-1-semialdehyde 2,1-aminomutase